MKITIDRRTLLYDLKDLATEKVTLTVQGNQVEVTDENGKHLTIIPAEVEK